MATAAFTTVVDRSIGDPITEAIWDDQIKDNVNQLASAHRNLLTNGGFEIWQRGAGAFTASGAYTADRWVLTEGGASAGSVTQESTTIDSIGQYSLACAYTHASTTTVGQTVENWRDLKGETISLSMRIRQSVASMVRLYINDGLTLTTGNTTATTGSFVTHTLTVTMSGSATQCVLGVQFIATGTAYIDNAMLVIGPSPAPYRPLHPQEDFARCQRYYEVHGGIATAMIVRGIATGAGQTFGSNMRFSVPKSGTPTVTKNGTWTATNCGQPTISAGANAGGYEIRADSSAAGVCNFLTDGTDDSVTAEHNP